MDRYRVSDEELARAAGCSRMTISRLRRGKAVPSFGLAAKIADFTKGKVKANDFLPETKEAAGSETPAAAGA